MKEIIRVDDQWYVLASSARADLQTRVLKNGEAFGIFNRFGDIQHIGIGEQGLYYEGTRFLSHLEIQVNDRHPMLLNSSVSYDNTLLAIDLTTPDLYRDGKLVIRKSELHIFRAKFLWDETFQEHVRFTNFSDRPLEITVTILVDCDYADIFEVRGVKREKRGRRQPPRIEEGLLELGYQGLDNIGYRTVIDCQPSPDTITDKRIVYSLALGPQQSTDIYLRTSFLKDGSIKTPLTFAKAFSECRDRTLANRTAFSDIHTSHEQFNEWLERSAADLRLLITETGQGLYPYAGIPWFCTPFGRDGIITALQCLWLYPDLARGVLTYLAATQAAEIGSGK